MDGGIGVRPAADGYVRDLDVAEMHMAVWEIHVHWSIDRTEE